MDFFQAVVGKWSDNEPLLRTKNIGPDDEKKDKAKPEKVTLHRERSVQKN